MNEASARDGKAGHPKQVRFNRIGYGVFTAAGMVFALVKDWNNAVIFFGLAPAFDPFGPLTFQERPRWQKIWLYVHVTITMMVIGLAIYKIWH